MRGLEIALVGVDGTGKTSIASTLAALSIPVRVIYMGGYKHFRSWPMKLAERGWLPWPFSRVAMHYELLTKRLSGLAAARAGCLVVYDRDPIEQVRLNPRKLKTKMHNLLVSLYYLFPPDLTFWLTGDYERLHIRKREQTAAELKRMDEALARALIRHRGQVHKLDVTAQSLDAVVSHIIAHIREQRPDIFANGNGHL